MNDVKKWMMESTVRNWRLGDDDMVEWYEYKGDGFFEYVDFPEREATKAFNKMRGDMPEES